MSTFPYALVSFVYELILAPLIGSLFPSVTVSVTSPAGADVGPQSLRQLFVGFGWREVVAYAKRTSSPFSNFCWHPPPEIGRKLWHIDQNSYCPVVSPAMVSIVKSSALSS